MGSALRQLPSFFTQLTALHELLEEAAEIAVAADHPVYDCFYIALARREGMPLVTADKRLASAARSHSETEVQLLSET